MRLRPVGLLFLALCACSPPDEPAPPALDTGTPTSDAEIPDAAAQDVRTTRDAASTSDVGRPDMAPKTDDAGTADVADVADASDMNTAPNCSTDEECLRELPDCDIADVERDPGNNWFDSYSVGDRCYCDSTFDHDIGDIVVDTPDGPKTVREVCEAIGPGPGRDGHPVYNDIQCGNGPANDAGDEDWRPGRVDQGRDGCCTAGPPWNFDGVDW